MVSAIVLAAGLSRRMGRPKLTLPWGETTVIGRVVATLLQAGLRDIVVVTGHRAEEVATVLAGSTGARRAPFARIAFNPNYAAGEMLSSVQTGLSELGSEGESDSAAALICLGDQPQMEVGSVEAVLNAGQATGWQRIVVPSYQMRAGHPILLPAWLWPEVMACEGTLRHVLSAHRDQTEYVVVATPTILADLDTPEQYEIEERKSKILFRGRNPPHAHVPPF